MHNASLVSSLTSTMHLHGQHDPLLSTLSVLVAIFTSWMALQTAFLARTSDEARDKQLTISIGSISLAGGIWTMHFIGMLAFGLPVGISYDIPTTMLSFLPALAASWLALTVLSARTQPTTGKLASSSILVGIGIAAMHYGGMAAIQTSAIITYELPALLLSCLVAPVLAFIALSVRFGLHKTRMTKKQRVWLSSATMGIAIAGMHYIGMHATTFTGIPSDDVLPITIDKTLIAIMLAILTLSVSALVAFANNLLRLRQLLRKMDIDASRMRAIVETAIDGIITIDGRGIIQAFNPSAERLFGWKADEVIGQNIKILMPDPDRTHHDSYISNFQQTGIPKIIGSGREVTGLRKDGSLMPMRLAVGRVELPGEAMYVGFVTDITERRQLESSLREAAEQARLAASAKTAFLANMSHEIRTPMNAIIGFSELLLKEELTPVQRRHLNTVHQSSRSLLSLLNDILDTTKLEKDSVELEIIDFSLQQLLEEIISTMDVTASAKGLLLEMHYPEDMPAYFKGDPLRIRQVLTNLIGNAIKFTEHGQVTLQVSYTDDVLYLQVTDTGIGMTPEQMNKIFDPFSQADNSISRRFGGTGLGTTISRQLTELMGGHIQVTSTLSRGSTFHVYLPLPLGKEIGTNQNAMESITLPPMHILIADDVPQNVELLTLILERQQHHVTSVRNGQEAVTQFTQGKFDLVLLDVHMPLMDGLEAARRIRAHEKEQALPATPIIALTASVMDSDRLAATAAGMNGFAAKPVELSRLTAEMARVLNLHDASDIPTGQQTEKKRTLPLIDWAAGIAMWGDEPRMRKAIHAFLTDVDTRLPLPDTISAQTDWPALAASLHGIRGAAGNLCLTSAAALAADIEKMVSKQQYNGMPAMLSHLKQLLHTVAHTLQASPDTKPAQQTAVVPVQDTGKVQQELCRLIACLENSELDNTALQGINDYLLASGRQETFETLNDALDMFDFEKGVALLRELEHALTTETPS